MISSGAAPVRFSTGSRFAASAVASALSETLSPYIFDSVIPRLLPASSAGFTGRLRDVTSVLWLRRDLRLRDHPALHAAAKDAPVVVLFVLDPALIKPAGAPRMAFLYRTLRALDAGLREHGGRLVV